MAEDTMENGWGVRLITHTKKRSGAVSLTQFRQELSAYIPHYSLHSVHISGTDANSKAICLATCDDYSRCLFGLGSYVGGDVRHQALSSSDHAGGLTMPQPWSTATTEAQTSTIPLPYYVPHDNLTEDELLACEGACLMFLHKRLLHGVFTGKPFKALLLEYVLGGNGGELSYNFLRRLGLLLHEFKVSVIADEVLTACRVSKSLLMTLDTPSEFQKCVSAVTMGKFLGCGVVLRRKTKEQTQQEEYWLRGFSTAPDCGMASKMMIEVVNKIEQGMIEVRRNQVLKLMKCDGATHKNDHWGHGLMIYTKYTRGQILYGLKNRCLPRMENTKLRKNSTTVSTWNRVTVCKALMDSANEWMVEQRQMWMESENPFIVSMVDYIFECASAQLACSDQVRFTTKEIIDNLDPNWATEAARKCNQKAGSSAKYESLMKRAILSSMKNTTNDMFAKKRMGYHRIEYNVFKCTCFVALYACDED